MKWLAQVQRADEAIFFWLSTQLRRPSKGLLARWVSRSGDGYGYLAVVAGMFAFGHEQASTLLAVLLLGYAIEIPTFLLLKNLLRRQRPYQRLLNFNAVIRAHDQFSFPSGHTTAAFMFAVIATALMPAWAPYLFAWAIAIGLSRIALGVHYLTDILAGALLGSGLAWFVLASYGVTP